METILSSLWNLIPKSATEFFGIAAMLCHLVGFYLYGKFVLSGETRPNIATWGMWFFGEVVDLLTYDSIQGSSWTTNAGPFACTVGVLGVSLIIIAQHVRGLCDKKKAVIYQPLDPEDKYFVLPDVSALLLWLKGLGTLGNFVSVGTTVVQYIPTYRETYRDPTVERVGPWAWWSIAYVSNFLAVATGPGSGEISLYFLPTYYFLLDAVMVWLCLRK